MPASHPTAPFEALLDELDADGRLVHVERIAIARIGSAVTRVRAITGRLNVKQVHQVV